MSKFFSLVKVNVLSLFGINKILHSEKRRAKGGAGLGLLLIIGVFVFIGYTYSKLIIEISETVEQINPLTMMLSLIFTVCVFFSFYVIGGLLFGSKDYDILSAMPLKSYTVITSKLFSTYVGDLLLTLILMIPGIILYGGNVSLDIGYVISYSLMLIFSPLFPLAVAIVLGLIINVITAKLRKRNTIQIVLSFIFIFGVIALGLASKDTFKVLNKIYLLGGIFEQGLNSVCYLLLFIGICVVSFSVVLFITCALYHKINTLMKAKSHTKKYKSGKNKLNSISKALFKRELKVLFSSATYALNTLLGSIISIAISVIIMVLVLKNGSPSGEIWKICVLVPALASFSLMMSPTTACSISVEGSSFWVIKSAPIKFNKILNTKIKVDLMFNLTAAIIMSFITVFIFAVPTLEAVLTILSTVFIAVTGAMLGLTANIIFPKLKWTTIHQAVKQSSSTLVCVICAFLFSILFGYMGIKSLTGAISIDLCLGLIFAFTALLSTVLYLIIIKKGEKILSARL